MPKTLNFQQVILRLQQYWAEKGCLVWQPYNTEVGAGTLNPATALRVIGPEPWNVAYLEPSARPADGRYGENPNRWGQYYQFQVILKPDPGNPQELYLASLEALGIDLAQHDVRFVEDNWASPALGAWGLGWEVWLDGQEISQYTYFQQAGGIELDPVSVEITYGLERIVMYLQQTDAFVDIQWSDDVTYGQVLFSSEVELCKYNFDVADIDRLTKLYDLYEQEAQNALAQGLVIPAHNYVLKCSHTFNILDARGAVGVTERARFFARMKALSSQVAAGYLAQREQMGYPLLREDEAEAPSALAVDPVATTEPRDFLLEVGTEELPVGDQHAFVAQLEAALPKLLADAHLDYESLRILSSPRHTAAYVSKLAASQPDRREVVKGPPAQFAYDGDGNPTKAALGFARSNGIEVGDLQTQDFDGREYVTAFVSHTGRMATEVLAEMLPALLSDIRFTRGMRWNQSQVEFSRPLRWLVALWGEHAIPFSFAGVSTDKVSRGLRSSGSPEFVIASAESYFEALAAQDLIIDPAARRALVWQQVQALAAEVGGQAQDDPDLLDEVSNLLEYPTAIRGTFDAEFLKLPQEVLIAVMKKHQRYFPLFQDGALMPYFITVANGRREDVDGIRHGNQEVLRARYADAAFFFQADSRHALESVIPRLDTLTFQVKLGSMKDKADRLVKLVPFLAEMLDVTDKELALAVRTAQLAKADLVTQMVIEHTSLQGVMGRYYALQSGEYPVVATAIQEHYLPRFAGDDMPTSTPAMLVGLADRLDSLVGLFAVGLAPTGSADRYGLRRQALGLAQMLVEKELDLDLYKAALMAAKLSPVQVSTAQQTDVVEFIAQRVRAWWLDEGYRYDLVDAALNARAANPYLAYQTLTALAEQVEQPAFAEILTAYSRPSRITRDLGTAGEVEPELLTEPAEIALYEAYESAATKRAMINDLAGLMAILSELVEPIVTFFEDVFVMVDDETIKANRLALLGQIAALPDGIVDLTVIQGY